MKKVLGAGNKKSKIAIFGLAPHPNGAGKTGVPLTSITNKRLFEPELERIGLKREDIYISNVIKKPLDDPDIDDVDLLGLGREIHKLKAKIIVGLGKTTCRAICDCFKRKKVKFEENTLVYLDSKHLLLQVYHPSYHARKGTKLSLEHLRWILKEQWVMVYPKLCTLYLKFRNKKKELLEIKLLGFYVFEHYRDPDGEAKSIFGDRYRRQKRVSFDPEQFIVHQRVLQLKYENSKIGYLDVETMYPSQPDVCSIITVLYKKTFYVFARGRKPKKSTYNGYKVIIKPIQKYRMFMEKMNFDILAGWNVNFDRDKVQIHMRRKFNMQSCYFYDMMHFYKKIVRESRVCYKLKYIASYELGTTKDDIDTSKADEEYRRDPERMIKYNIKDVLLLKLLNDKLTLIEFAGAIAEYGNVNLRKVEWNSRIIEAMFIRQTDLYIPRRQFGNEEEMDSYHFRKKFISTESKFGGGFVMIPKPGIYENICVFDMKALYPSIMQTLNMSPETLRVRRKSHHILAPSDPDNRNDLTIEDIEKYKIKFYEDVHYTTKTPGILATLAKKTTGERERLRSQMSGYVKTKKNRSLYMKQYAVKVLANSFFGVMGFEHFFLYDKRIAQGICAMGRTIIKFLSKKAMKLGYQTIYTDTDSNFIKIDDVKEIPKVEKMLNKKLKKLGKICNTPCNALETKFEKRYTRFLIVKKKKYAGIIEGKEGDPEVKGFECKRSDHSKYSKEIQKNMIFDILKTGKIKTKYPTHPNELKAIPLRDLAVPKKLTKDLDDYSRKSPPIHVRAARKSGIELNKHDTVWYLNLYGGDVVAINNMNDEEIDAHKNKVDYYYMFNKTVIPKLNLILNLMDIHIEDVKINNFKSVVGNKLLQDFLEFST